MAEVKRGFDIPFFHADALVYRLWYYTNSAIRMDETDLQNTRWGNNSFENMEGNMNKKIRTEAVDHLFEAILSLDDKEECYSFFEDLCTVNELMSLSQRFEVAAMLRKHKTYLEIAEKTGASTATISRVNRSLNYGDDGYALVFSKMKES